MDPLIYRATHGGEGFSMRWRVKTIEQCVRTAEASSLKRALGPGQLIMLGLSAIVGTGIFILVAGAVQRGGPGAIAAFAVAGAICAAAALCYAELGSMIPLSGGSYSYAYASLGEVAAWMVGWALLAEYIVGASAISVGWSAYVTYLLATAHDSIHWLPAATLPRTLTTGYFGGGLVNLPAMLIVALVTCLLAIGTRTGVRFAIVLIALKLLALFAFIVLATPHAAAAHFIPFAPLGAAGIGAAASSVFFAYLGFDGVASAAEEVHNPRRNVPVGLLGAVGVATLLYIAVSAGAVGAVGGQPVRDAAGAALRPATMEFAARCRELASAGPLPLACSDQALAHVLRVIGHPLAANAIAIAVFIALPSAIVSTLYAQSRLLFALGRDGLLPSGLASVHPVLRTPVRMILLTGLITGALAALLPIGQLADVANGGTLFAFFMTAIGLLALRRSDKARPRPFRLPAAWLIAPLAAAGCAALFVRLPSVTLGAFALWMAAGMVLYAGYGVRGSRMGRGGSEDNMLPLDQPSRQT